MDHLEELMYKIMSEMTHNNLPLVFKGGLITKLILQENGFNSIERRTVDIDANWIGQKPTMKYLEKSIDEIVKKIDKGMEAVAFREYGEKRSAGIAIKRINEEGYITKVDIDIKPVNSCVSYFYGDTRFKGTTVNHILCDKISCVSGDHLFRRVKDIVDIYALSQCVKVRSKDIYNAAKLNEREIKDFSALLNQSERIKHAYDKLEIAVGKPDFSLIYTYVKKFLNPFIEKNLTNQYWNSKKETWIQERQIEKKNIHNLKHNRSNTYENEI